MPQPTSTGVNSSGNTVRHSLHPTTPHLCDDVLLLVLLTHMPALCPQYTTYSNGGYSYNNSASSSNNNSGSHYYSPSGNTSGFYTQNGGKSGGGYSYYQNSCAAPFRVP